MKVVNHVHLMMFVPMMFVGTVTIGLCLSSGVLQAAQPGWFDLTQHRHPDIAVVGDDPFGKLVKYGYALFPIHQIRSGRHCPTQPGASLATIWRARAAICRLEPSHLPCPWSASGVSFRNTVHGRAQSIPLKIESMAAWSAA